VGPAAESAPATPARVSCRRTRFAGDPPQRGDAVPNPNPSDSPLAKKPNYDFEKRKKEQDRKKKKDQKREDRLARKRDGIPEPEDGEEGEDASGESDDASIASTGETPA
jgi:hypothetical protein